MKLMSKLVAATVLTLSLAITGAYTRYPKSSEIRLRDYLFNHPNYSSKARPVLDSSAAVNVTLKMHLYAMIQFNERDEVLTTASWMEVRWKDERLSWNPAEFDWLSYLVLNVEDIWTPDIFLVNSLDNDALKIVSPDRGTIVLSPSGAVSLGAPFIVSTQCALQIQYFPFDTQVCSLTFVPENQGPNSMDLTMEYSATPSYITSLEWYLWMPTVSNVKHSFYVTSTFSIYLQRDPRHYISTIIIPSTVMCLLALATFLAPPDSGERISLGVSMVLGLTVFQLLIADTLPTSSKQSPILSNYLSVNFLIACLAVPFSLVNINIAYREKRLKFLKYRWIRMIFLKYLPCCMGVPIRGTIWSNKVAIMTEKAVPKDDGKVHPDETQKKNDWHLHNASVPDDLLEKVKQENRLVALVMDRLFLAGFLTLFAIVIIKVVFDFSSNPCGEY